MFLLFCRTDLQKKALVKSLAQKINKSSRPESKGQSRLIQTQMVSEEDLCWSSSIQMFTTEGPKLLTWKCCCVGPA